MEPGFIGLGSGRGGDAHHVVKAAFLQAEAEGCGIAVAAVGDDERDVDAPRPCLVDHVQGQLQLLDMTDLFGNTARRSAGHLARIGLGRGWSQLSGRNRRQPTAADALSEAGCRDTPAWQLVTLPAVPVYCRATQAEASPSLEGAHCGSGQRLMRPRMARTPRARRVGSSRREAISM